MLVPSSQLPDHSRIWIYQSSREFTRDEIESISAETENFLQTWTAHDKSLKAGFEIRYNRFLILMIDEKVAGASGCSIDKSVHFVQALEKKYDINFLDRMKFAFDSENGVEVVSGDRFRELFSSGALTGDSLVFNNLIGTKKELSTGWKIPVKDSWHHNFVST